MALKVLVEPLVEPVSFEDFRGFGLPDAGESSGELTSALVSARRTCERLTRRKFITTTIRQTRDRFPYGINAYAFFENAGAAAHSSILALRYPPVQSIIRIQYIDGNGTTQTLDPSSYIADLQSEPARLSPLYGQPWPIVRIIMNAVTIDYTCGYGDEPTDVPEDIRRTIMQLALFDYENKLPADGSIPKYITDKLMPYKDLRL